MKIAIIGTRGIPNRYGGFEQFASRIGPMLAKRGYQVLVYNPSSHEWKRDDWQGVEIVRKYDGHKVGQTMGQFIYDLLCILDVRKRKPDIILQLGYTSSSIWSFLFPRCSYVVTNMDGLEWKRNKYNRFSRAFLRFAEKLAVNKSHILIADSIRIKNYIKDKFGKEPLYIPYGATLFKYPDPAIPINYGLTPGDYDLMISRFVPENHIEMIIKGFIDARSNRKLVIVGMDGGNYSKRLYKKYHSSVIIFKEGIYDLKTLNNLRYYSNLYFHGHSVGGTNPSLLEAMACRCLIIAHNNIYNKEVLDGNAYYFDNESDISFLLNLKLIKKDHFPFLDRNARKLKEVYNWDIIINELEDNIIRTKKSSFVYQQGIYHEHRL